MPPQSSSQQQSSGDNSMAPVWITILLFFTAFFIWKFAHQHIVAGVFFVNLLEAKFINLFIDNPSLKQAIYSMETVNPSSVNWSQFTSLLAEVGSYVRYPIIAISIGLAIWLYQSNIKLKFRKTHNMQTLKQQEQYNWPAIMPVVKEDLVTGDINKGPWAMALNPLEFARKYQLLKKEDKILDNPTPGTEMTAAIKKADAKRVFTLQLGPYWENFARCGIHVIAVAAVFMARINRDRKSATMILETIDKSYSMGKPDFKVALPVLKKYQNTELVREVLMNHAYLLTVMASLLERSRKDGVVPTAEFLWLKPLDRRLWYMLNCVGRQTAYAEVAGPFAHWKAETRLQRRSLVPMIDEAIKALELAVKEVKLSRRELQGLPA